MNIWEEIVENLTAAAHRSEGPEKLSATVQHGNVVTISRAAGPRWAMITMEETQLIVEHNLSRTTERIERYAIAGNSILLDEQKKCEAKEFVRDVILKRLVA